MPQKVLIVDDEPLMRMLYQKHLEDAGYQMLTASDGAQAMDLVRREDPNVIVMDVVMPNMDGLAALRALKKDDATKTIPVIIITSQLGAHQTTRQEAERAGASLFLAKPFGPAQLLAAIRQVCPAPRTPGVPG